jgi:hypothetical protein
MFEHIIMPKPLALAKLLYELLEDKANLDFELLSEIILTRSREELYQLIGHYDQFGDKLAAQHAIKNVEIWNHLHRERRGKDSWKLFPLLIHLEIRKYLEKDKTRWKAFDLLISRVLDVKGLIFYDGHELEEVIDAENDLLL